MLRAHDAHGNSAVNSTVLIFIRQNEIMYLLYNALAHRNLILYKLRYKIKCFLMSDRFHMIFHQRSAAVQFFLFSVDLQKDVFSGSSPPILRLGCVRRDLPCASFAMRSRYLSIRT